jgi:thiol-disulfide isomerase/thioredoxin
VRDLAGHTATLPAASGGARLINVWALWCPPCRQELPSLQRLASALAPRGIEITAIALADDSFPVREYLAENAAALHCIVLSPGAPAASELNLNRLPQTFLVAADGAVIARWTGAREWDSPSVRDQLDRLLESA